MIKIENNSKNIKKYYQELKMDFLFDSIYEVFTKANIFIKEDCQLIIVHEGHGFFFGGKSNDEQDYIDVIHYFKDKIVTNDLKQKLHFAKVYYTNERWKKVLMEELSDFKPNIYPRVLFEYQKDEPVPKRYNNHDVEIYEITRDILKRKDEHTIDLINEIKQMWGSIEQFLKYGFGYCAIIDNEIAGWCTCEYLSQKQCGIGIETIEKFQKLGIGSLTATYLVNKCISLNLIPHWDSWRNNLPSVRIAEKLKFNKINDYNIIILNLE